MRRHPILQHILSAAPRALSIQLCNGDKTPTFKSLLHRAVEGKSRLIVEK